MKRVITMSDALMKLRRGVALLGILLLASAQVPSKGWWTSGDISGISHVPSTNHTA
jgi:hypothetical protein